VHAFVSTVQSMIYDKSVTVVLSRYFSKRRPLEQESLANAKVNAQQP